MVVFSNALTWLREAKHTTTVYSSGERLRFASTFAEIMKLFDNILRYKIDFCQLWCLRSCNVSVPVPVFYFACFSSCSFVYLCLFFSITLLILLLFFFLFLSLFFFLFLCEFVFICWYFACLSYSLSTLSRRSPLFSSCCPCLLYFYYIL